MKRQNYIISFQFVAFLSRSERTFMSRFHEDAWRLHTSVPCIAEVGKQVRSTSLYHTSSAVSYLHRLHRRLRYDAGLQP